MNQTVFVLGVNHRTAPVELRERLAFANGEVIDVLTRLKAQSPALCEAALLSTCNRTEVVGVSADSAVATRETLAVLGAVRGVDCKPLAGASYRFEGADAVRHLFRVGASLDSMVVGETQILGQLKFAYAQAVAAGTVSLVLHRAFHKAFAVAKRIRKDTLIGHGSVSVSSVAVGLAAQIFDTLADKTVMLLGAGRMAEIAARHFKAHGVQSILICSRTFENAAAIAQELGGTAVPMQSLRNYLKLADIVIGSLAATQPILGPSEFEAVIRERRYRPVFLIDLGVPRNFDARLNGIENIYLYDIDDLEKVAARSRSERASEVERAEAIVELELAAFLKWLERLDLVPAIKRIRLSMEELRDLELDRHRGWLMALDAEARERVEMLTRGLMNKVLHRIMTGLRQGVDGSHEGLDTAELAGRLLCGGGRSHSFDDESDDEPSGPI